MPPPDRKKLLVVDDDQLILQMLADLFEGEFEVIGCRGGAEAVATLERVSVSGVICDQMMPGMMGVDVLQRCGALRPHAARVLMTASDKVQDASDAVNRARVHRFIIKPFRSLEVVGIVKGAIHEVELERENEALVEELQKLLAQVRAREQELEHELDLRTRELKEVMEHLMKEPGG